MDTFAKSYWLGIVVFGLTACSKDTEVQQPVSSAIHSHETDEVHAPAKPDDLLDDWLAQFDRDSIIGTPSLVDCILSGGTQTSCVSITLKPAPANLTLGPWCPRNIQDGPELAGIWLEGGKVYDADGEFIKNLSTFYVDDIWQMFDPETGAINVTDSKVSCAAAARPDVAQKYQNYCVECQVSYMQEGASNTYVIPFSPIKATTASRRVGFSGVGIAFSGVRIDASAPTHAILGAHTLAPFDDCGGHVNLHAGYHIHAITGDCLKEVETGNEHATKIGIAMDGFALHSRLNPDGSSVSGLDRCGGHEFSDLGYHYHASDPGKNAILACHTGEVGCALNDASTSCDATKRPPRP